MKAFPPRKHKAPFPLDFESEYRIVHGIWTFEQATSPRSRGASTETVVGALGSGHGPPIKLTRHDKRVSALSDILYDGCSSVLLLYFSSLYNFRQTQQNGSSGR